MKIRKWGGENKMKKKINWGKTMSVRAGTDS